MLELHAAYVHFVYPILTTHGTKRKIQSMNYLKTKTKTTSNSVDTFAQSSVNI